MKFHCTRCKKPISDERGKCSDCKSITLQEQIEKRDNRKLSKYKNTMFYGVNKVRSVADSSFWSSAHSNCFRATISVDKFGKWKGESEAHVDTQYERWKYHRKLGRTVYCNLRLKKGMGRPDLIVVDKEFVFIEEIVCSEKEASIVLKKKKYPFPVNVIKTYKRGKNGAIQPR